MHLTLQVLLNNELRCVSTSGGLHFDYVERMLLVDNLPFHPIGFKEICKNYRIKFEVSNAIIRL